MASKWSKFSKEELEKIVNNSYSYRTIAEKLGYAPDGGSGIAAVKNMIEYYQFDISHFTGQGWNKNNFDYSRFRYGNKMRTKDMRDALIHLRGYKCEMCGITDWLNKPITLEIHHIDGDQMNNVLENLQLLCPNCHSQTDNWRGKNIDKQNKTSKITEEDFVKALQESENIRQALLKLGLTAAGGNYATAYKLIEQYNIKHLK